MTVGRKESEMAKQKERKRKEWNEVPGNRRRWIIGTWGGEGNSRFRPYYLQSFCGDREGGIGGWWEKTREGGGGRDGWNVKRLREERMGEIWDQWMDKWMEGGKELLYSRTSFCITCPYQKGEGRFESKAEREHWLMMGTKDRVVWEHGKWRDGGRNGWTWWSGSPQLEG